MARLGENPEIPPFMMYSEVYRNRWCIYWKPAKSAGPAPQPDNLGRFPAQDLRQYGLLCSRIVLRPQEISNNPEIIRRLASSL